MQSELNEKLRQCLEDVAQLDDFHALDSEEEAERTTLEDYIRDIKEHIQDRKLAKQIASEEQDPFEESDQHPDDGDDGISLTDVRTDIYGNIFELYCLFFFLLFRVSMPHSFDCRASSMKDFGNAWKT